MSHNQPVELTSYLCQRCFSIEDWKLWFILVSEAAHPLFSQVIVALGTSVEAVLSTCMLGMYKSK